MATIMIIRHADKSVVGGAGGVNASGISDCKSLTPRGSRITARMMAQRVDDCWRQSRRSRRSWV
jgi:hypothetical protein